MLSAPRAPQHGQFANSPGSAPVCPDGGSQTSRAVSLVDPNRPVTRVKMFELGVRPGRGFLKQEEQRLDYTVRVVDFAHVVGPEVVWVVGIESVGLEERGSARPACVDLEYTVPPQSQLRLGWGYRAPVGGSSSPRSPRSWFGALLQAGSVHAQSPGSPRKNTWARAASRGGASPLRAIEASSRRESVALRAFSGSISGKRRGPSS